MSRVLHLSKKFSGDSNHCKAEQEVINVLSVGKETVSASPGRKETCFFINKSSSQSERERGEYRKGREGKDDFFWYIQTRDLDEETITAFQEKTVEPIDLSPEQTSYAFPQTRREPRPANAPKQYSIEEEKKDLPF